MRTTDRIIDISEQAAHLHVRHDNLVIARNDAADVSLPLREVGVLVVSHPRVSYTHSVLTGLAGAGGILIICDEKHMPAAMMLPVQSHHTQTQRFALQAHMKKPTCKRLWQQIVRAKIRAQAALLHRLHDHDSGLPRLAGQVRSGDPDNIEAQAARRYWSALFESIDFRRRRDAQDCNRHLNYGYTVLRAVTARAICAAGLHPTLGLHHHNRYSGFCLADDLMEPLRPVVDEAVHELVACHGADLPMDRPMRAALLDSLTGTLDLGGEQRTLFDVASRMAGSLVAVLEDPSKKLILPTPH
jgi:CRISP-associated protein Cas1